MFGLAHFERSKGDFDMVIINAARDYFAQRVTRSIPARDVKLLTISELGRCRGLAPNLSLLCHCSKGARCVKQIRIAYNGALPVNLRVPYPLMF